MRRPAEFQVISALAFCAFMLPCSSLAYSGVISVDTVEAIPGTQVNVPVRLSNNDVPISALAFPLKYSSPYLSVDSISFAGSILPSDFDGKAYFTNIYGVIDTIRISYFPHFVNPIPTIDTTAGVVATIFFSVSPSAPPGTTIPIDSINWDSVFQLDTAVFRMEMKITASDITGQVVYYLDHVPGAVVVRSPTDVNDGVEPSGLPTSFNLSQNFPNPFNPSTIIRFALPRPSHVELEVFNILGQKVVTLIDKHLPAGSHEIEFNAFDYPSGIYFYRLSHDQGVETRKMTLIK
jgi:hypothetical protein